jgi:hypothetical protein
MSRGQPSFRTALKREQRALREMQRNRNKRHKQSAAGSPADNGDRASALAAGGAVAPDSSRAAADDNGRARSSAKPQPGPSGATVNFADVEHGPR